MTGSDFLIINQMFSAYPATFLYAKKEQWAAGRQDKRRVSASHGELLFSDVFLNIHLRQLFVYLSQPICTQP